MEVECVDKIHDHSIRLDICSIYNTNDKIRSYIVANGSAAYNKERLDHIIGGSINHLQVKVFGNECLWISSFIQLKPIIA